MAFFVYRPTCFGISVSYLTVLKSIETLMHCTSPLGRVLCRMSRCFQYSEVTNLIHSVWTSKSFFKFKLHFHDQIFDHDVNFCLILSKMDEYTLLSESSLQNSASILMHRKMNWSTAMNWTRVNQQYLYAPRRLICNHSMHYDLSLTLNMVTRNQWV